LVLAGHLIGDWIVQTDSQARLKVWPLLAVDKRTPTYSVLRRLSWSAGAKHSLGYHLTMAACVAPAWHNWWALVALVVSVITHFVIDRRGPVKWLMRHTGSEPFSRTVWGPLVVDQALHLSILGLLVGWLA